MNSKRRWTGLISGLAFVLAWGGPAFAEGPVDRFAGLWNVTVTPDHATAQAGKDEFRDNLLIEADGLFTAEGFGPMGFPSVPLTVSGEETNAPFSVTTANDSQGTVTWTGNTNGSSISGTVLWVRPSGTVHRYAFTGVLE